MKYWKLSKSYLQVYASFPVGLCVYAYVFTHLPTRCLTAEGVTLCNTYQILSSSKNKG